jgi:quinol monooxygenase YgiN
VASALLIRNERSKLKVMHIIIWEFTVKEEHIKEFISAYRSNGDWATLFRRAQGYLRTELLRSFYKPNIFLTVDRWESATCFDIFEEQFGAEYKKLDARLEGYTSSEEKVGIFSEA